jgi:hypothetical protein
MSLVLDAIGAVFKPISDVIDHLTVSGDQKVALQQTVLQGQITAATQIQQYEQELLDARVKVVLAEAQGGSWLQRNWRPITMITFLVLVVCDSFGLLKFRLADQAWSLLQLGLGGYVVGRSVEKVAGPVVQAITAAVKK